MATNYSMMSERGTRALRLSLAMSAVSLFLKLSAYTVTHSNSALSDAAESVVHLIAVGFVYMGYQISRKPEDEQHLYGHERVEFFSVGVEGLVIIMAGVTIIYQSIQNIIEGYEPAYLTLGIGVMGLAGVLNLILGLYLVKVGREEENMIVYSNGKHTLTDVWTTVSVLATLAIIQFTDWLWLDSIVGIALAFYLGYEGLQLIYYSVSGLMDTKDQDVDAAIKKVLENKQPQHMKSYHNLRHRKTGQTTWVEFHALFDENISLRQAHKEATIMEGRIMDAIDGDAIVTIHPEPEETHVKDHKMLKGINKARNLEDFT